MSARTKARPVTTSQQTDIRYAEQSEGTRSATDSAASLATGLFVRTRFFFAADLEGQHVET